MTSFTVLALELEPPGDGWVLIRPAPGSVLVGVPTLAYLYHVQGEWCLAYSHVAEYDPAMEFPCQLIRVPAIDGDPSVERTGFVGPRERLP